MASENPIVERVVKRDAVTVRVDDVPVVVDVLMQYAAPNARRISLGPSMRSDVAQEGALSLTIDADGVDDVTVVAGSRGVDAVASVVIDLDACGAAECVASATVTLSTTAGPADVDLAVEGVIQPFETSIFAMEAPQIRMELRPRD